MRKGDAAWVCLRAILEARGWGLTVWDLGLGVFWLVLLFADGGFCG